jgi:hypothetical protein
MLAAASPRLAQSERARQVARDPVVPERGDERAPGVLGLRSVALEDIADEPRLAGGIEVVGTGRHGCPHRRLPPVGERAHRRHEDIAAADEGVDAVGTLHVGDERVQAPELLRERQHAVRTPPGQHRAQPAPHHRPRRQVARVTRGAEEDDAPRHHR